MTARRALFDARRRLDNSYSRHDETWFDFLDRVDDVVFDRIRTLLNAWFDEVPPDKAARLREEFRSGRDGQVEAGFLELFLHAAFVRTPLGVELEPGRQRGRQPDFRCWPLDEAAAEFLVEARIVGDPPSRRAREKRLKRAFDDVNQAAPPGFTVMVSIRREGAATPRGAELRRRILPWLESLDHDRLRAAVEAGTNPDFPERDFDVGNWTFRIRAWPLSASALEADRPHRMIGVEPARTAWGGSTREFAAALRAKTGRYELAGRPYVIALGNTHMFQSADDPLDVLYGQEAIEIIGESEQGLETRAIRKPDGLFRPDRNRRVSAVLHIPQLWPWTVAAAEPELWVNPFALNPVPMHLRWAAEMTLAGPVVRRRTAEQPLRELFGLSETWPGPEGAFDRRGSA
jgi:hypothetical protein